MDKKSLAIDAVTKLKTVYPSPVTELEYSNEMQLSIAVALSAQTTDKKVNQITKTLFKKYNTWEDFSNANLEVLQNDIHGVNFHRGKAERLIKMAKKVVADYNSVLPRSMTELMTLPGIARKSANVIMQELWGIAEGIVVDTHITRVSQRLSLTTNSDAKKIEQDLMQLLPQEYWKDYSSTVVLHGRYICKARKPECANCVLNKVCPSAFLQV